VADTFPVSTDSPALAALAPAPAVARLNVLAEVDAHLHQLLDHPPLGHSAELQPSQWYELVFDDMAAAYNARRNAGGQP
jgi:hypothetical protein